MASTRRTTSDGRASRRDFSPRPAPRMTVVRVSVPAVGHVYADPARAPLAPGPPHPSFCPPHHPAGTIHKTKADAEAAEAAEHNEG